jgi:integrase
MALQIDDVKNSVRRLDESKIHTPLHKRCPVCIELRKLAKRGNSLSAMGLKEAGEVWLSQKKWKRRKPKTIECCGGYLRALLDFYGDMPLQEFHAGSLLAYQEHRIKTVGPSAINHELNALSQILRQAGLWAKLKDYYGPLPEPQWQKPKVFTFEEQQRIFDFAKDDPGLELAELVFTITRWTSASGSELRLARLKQLSLQSNPPTFEVTGDTTKNDIRPRLIPLEPEAEDAFRRAQERAYRLGAHRDDHFIFPFRVNPNTWDPTRPASRGWLRKQSAALRALTGIKHLSPHKWRHQLCTELLELGKTRDEVIAIMGWCSEKMIETYSHTRLQAKSDTLRSLRKIGPKSEGLPTKNLIVFPQR